MNNFSLAFSLHGCCLFFRHCFIGVYVCCFFDTVPLNLASEARTLVVQNDSMVIQWRYITSVERPSQFFIITATRVDTNVTEVEEMFDTMFWREDAYQYTVRGLKEFKWYDIRMAAGNPAGMAPFLVDQVTNRTLEGGKITMHREHLIQRLQ